MRICFDFQSSILFIKFIKKSTKLVSCGKKSQRSHTLFPAQAIQNPNYNHPVTLFVDLQFYLLTVEEARGDYKSKLIIFCIAEGKYNNAVFPGRTSLI